MIHVNLQSVACLRQIRPFPSCPVVPSFALFPRTVSLGFLPSKKNTQHAARSPGRMLASVRICLSPSMCLHLSPTAARSPGRMLARVRIYLSQVCAFTCLPVCAFMCCQIAGPHPRQCAHSLPGMCFSLPVLPDRRLVASVRIYLSPSMRLHLSPSAARSLSRMLASARIFTCLPIFAFICLLVLPDRWAACSPVYASTCLHYRAATVSEYIPSFVPALPDCWAACLPVCTGTCLPACAFARPHARQCAHLLVSSMSPNLSSCVLASVKMFLSPSMRLHVFLSFVAGRVLASARIYLSPSMCLCQAACSSVRICLSPVCPLVCFPVLPDCRLHSRECDFFWSPSMRLHVFLIFVAGSHARQCAHLLVFQRVLHLSPRTARPPGRMLAM